MSIFFNYFKEKIGKNIPFSSGTQTAATRPPFSPWRQSRLSFEKWSLFSCLYIYILFLYLDAVMHLMDREGQHKIVNEYQHCKDVLPILFFD